MANDGFLDSGWRDSLALIGVIGVILTALGVWFAYRQMKKTTSANEAATLAAVQALTESRRQYNRYVVGQASRILSEIRGHVRRQEWEVAGIRLIDLADLTVQVAGDDPEWRLITEKLHTMESTFDRLHRREIGFTPGLRRKWDEAHRELRTKIAANYGPFPVAEGDPDDD